jgi:hypothetical protein
MEETKTPHGDNCRDMDELLEHLEQLDAEIRRRLLALIEHPDTSDSFKNHPHVKEWTK